METAIYLIALLIAIPVLYPVVRAIVRVYRRYHGTRLIVCPETHKPAAVEVDAGRAVMTALAGHQILELQDCSRWPERAHCGQECLSQIEKAPEECLLRSIVGRWYQGKNCVYCHRPLSVAHWIEHQPALRNPEGRTIEWNQIPPEKILDVFETHQPVCWDCHVAETFRRQFPDLVTDRPEHGAAETHEMRSSK